MPAGQAQALRKRLLIRLGIAVPLLAVGLIVLAWLNATQPSVSPERSGILDSKTAAPAVRAGTPVEKTADASTSVPLQSESVGAATSPAEPKKSEADAEQASVAAASPPVPPVAQAAGATPESAKAKPVPAPKQKLPRGPHLQAGVFSQAANAEELKSKFEAEGLPVYIESRVQIGPFKTRKDAEKMREKLKAEGVTTVLIAQ